MDKPAVIGMGLAISLPTIILWLAGVLPGQTALILLMVYGVLTAASFLLACSIESNVNDKDSKTRGY